MANWFSSHCEKEIDGPMLKVRDLIDKIKGKANDVLKETSTMTDVNSVLERLEEIIQGKKNAVAEELKKTATKTNGRMKEIMAGGNYRAETEHTQLRHLSPLFVRTYLTT